MEVALVKTNIDFETFTDSIRAVHEFWLDIYARSPFVAMFVIVMIPVIILYMLYVWRTVHRSEKFKDEEVWMSYQSGIKKKRRKK